MHRDIGTSESNFNSQTCTKIAITGGKGGVGKTSVALKLALEFSRNGRKVLLIDCDANLSNTSIKLGLTLDNRFEKLLTAEKTFEECIYRLGNFHLLPACNGSLDMFEEKVQFEDIIQDIIFSHQDEYDFILLDCPAGISKSSLTLSALCDERIIVVVPDRSSITDSYSLIKMLSKKHNILHHHLVVNMYQTEKQLTKVTSTLTETVENFLGVRLFPLGGVLKLDIDSEHFDTFFLSQEKNELNKNFAKLLYKFTENKVEPQRSVDFYGSQLLAPEQYVR